MAGLSSTTRIRRLRGVSYSPVLSKCALVWTCSSMCHRLRLLLLLLILRGQVECECRAQPGTVAAHCQRSAQVVGGERRAVEAETVARLAGRESVIEDPGEVLRGDTDPVVHHTDPDAVTDAGRSQRHRCIRPAGFHTGLFRVTDEIDENLHGLVLI